MSPDVEHVDALVLILSLAASVASGLRAARDRARTSRRDLRTMESSGRLSEVVPGSGRRPHLRDFWPGGCHHGNTFGQMERSRGHCLALR